MICTRNSYRGAISPAPRRARASVGARSASACSSHRSSPAWRLLIGFAGDAPLVLLPIAALIVLSIVMMRLSRAMPRKTPEGAEAAAKWQAFRRYLDDIEKYRAARRVQSDLRSHTFPTPSHLGRQSPGSANSSESAPQRQTGSKAFPAVVSAATSSTWGRAAGNLGDGAVALCGGAARLVAGSGEFLGSRGFRGRWIRHAGRRYARSAGRQ